jgi:hypothetical protein
VLKNQSHFILILSEVRRYICSLKRLKKALRIEMNYKIIFSIFLIHFAHTKALQAQELNCQVQVNYSQIQGSVTRVYESMESDIRDFVNNQRWTNDEYKQDERIKCNMLITINSTDGNGRFEASLQVTSSRPVFNSDYESPILNINDQSFAFQYLENTPLLFSPDQFRSNLTSVLAFYAYIILGYDYDTFSFKGGDQYFNIAQQIVNSAQNKAFSGWRAVDSDRNRYWIIENILAGNFIPLREAYYKYHRLGLDKMYDSVISGRGEVSNSLDLILKVHQSKPLAYATQIFFQAKAIELVNIFSEASPQEKTAAYSILQKVDPGNLSKYNQLKN